MSSAVSLFPHLSSVPSSSTLLLSSTSCRLSASWAKLPSRTTDLLFSQRRRRWVVSSSRRTKGENDGEEEDMPKKAMGAFLDDEGTVVNDLDAYLNGLSLEYDSVWDTKPSWCQPWTIVLTGAAVTGCSWEVLHSTLVTAVVFSLICTWWYLFLYIYPKEYADMIEERRRNVTAGVEDTFGARKDK